MYKLHNRPKLNNEYRVVFQPKLPQSLGVIVKRQRFAIGAGNLANYIGENNANKAIQAADELTNDKLRIKYRKHGTIDIYIK